MNRLRSCRLAPATVSGYGTTRPGCNLPDQRSGALPAEPAAHVSNLDSVLAEQRSQKQRLVVRVAGPRHERPARTTQHSFVHFVPDVVSYERENAIDLGTELFGFDRNIEGSPVACRIQFLE